MPKKSLKMQPWHRWPGETEATHGLFRLYLEMGEERSLLKVCEESGRKYELVARLSSRFKWSYRAKGYDDYIFSLQESTVEKTLKKDAIIYAQRRSIYRNKEYTMAGLLLQQAEEMLAAPLYEQKIVETQIVNGQEVPLTIILKPAKWNKNTARSYVQTAAEIMRLNLEMETQRIGVVHMNLEDPNVRLQMARASLEKLTKNVDQLVDQQIEADPKLNRQQVTSAVLQQLPLWCAADWKLTQDQIPLLTEGLNINPLTALYPSSEDEVLPFPVDDDMEPGSDLEM